MGHAGDVRSSRLILIVALLAAGCGDDSVADPVPSPASTPSTSTTTTPASTTVPPSSSASLTPATGVVEFDGRITDPARDREIPYRAYAPAGVDGAVPVVLVSHGGSGSPRGYTRGGHLGSTFAAAGFLAVHVGHLASTAGSRQVFDRPADVTAVLDALQAGLLDLPEEFTGSADLERVGHVGHSFGAYTSHAVGGAVFDRDLSDPRIDAIVPISPAGPNQFGAFVDENGTTSWSTVTIPVFSLVGRAEIDTNAVGTIDEPGWRLVPFQEYPDVSDRYLAIIDGQTHSDMWSTGSDDVEAFIADEIASFLAIYVAGVATIDRCGIGVGELAGVTLERAPSAAAPTLANCG